MEGIQYVGIGNSTNKKDAQTNAAFDFANYLVRTGKVSQHELPLKTVNGLLIYHFKITRIINMEYCVLVHYCAIVMYYCHSSDRLAIEFNHLLTTFLI